MESSLVESRVLFFLFPFFLRGELIAYLIHLQSCNSIINYTKLSMCDEFKLKNIINKKI